MAQFPPAYDYIMRFEDPEHLYASVTDNNGAQVISGINAAAWPSDFALVNAIFQPQRGPAVANFYQTRLWAPLQLGGLESQDVANRVLDEEVNAGRREAILLLQRAVNVLHAGTLVEDGAVGPLTLAAANAADPEALLATYRAARAASYQAIVAANSDDARYLATWLARAQA
jgi:Predicted Peptidoglycan domain